MQRLGRLAGGLLAAWALFAAPIHADDDVDIDSVVKKAGAGDAEAEEQLAKAYFHGKSGRPKDYAEGLAWAQKAADQNNVDAKSTLGWAYQNGYGVKQDQTQAFAWFTKAAQGGDDFGEMKLAEYYEHGLVVPQDLAKARSLFEQAAKGGNDRAKTELALMYVTGAGVPKDDRKAFRWFLSASFDDFGWAQNCLGVVYTEGLFVPKNPIEAERWFLLAEKNGYDEPNEKQGLADGAKKLTSAQMAEAQEMVKNWNAERTGDIQAGRLSLDFGPDHDATLPLQDFYDHLYVLATVNGHPGLKFMIDSGCNISLIDRGTAVAINVPTSDDYRLARGIGPNTLLTPESTPVKVELGGLTLSGVRFMELATSGWDEHIGLHLDGVIGCDLLRHFVLHIDYIKQTVELIDPADFKPPGDGATVVPLTFSGLPTISTTIDNGKGASVSADLLVDTGDSATMSLPYDFFAVNPEQHIDQAGFPGRFGGIGGVMTTTLHKLGDLKIGSIVVAHPSVFVADRAANIDYSTIGEGILQRFDVTIDIPGQKLYLKPNADFGDPFLYVEVGMEIRATGTDLRTFIVHTVASNTAAAQAGFRAGDMLTRIDGVPVASLTTGKVLQLMDDLKPHKVTVTRSGKPVTLDFGYDGSPPLK